ncbi:uracil-DNA glycosylase [bacterium]|nr:uracil-DNA glycosylase [bacterium]
MSSREPLIPLVKDYLIQEMTLGRWQNIAPETLPPEPGDPKAYLEKLAKAKKKAEEKTKAAAPPSGAGNAAGDGLQKVRQPFQPEGKSKIEDLKRLREYMLECRQCPLFKDRHNLVFGSGDPEAKIMFIGEAPGEDEDLQGEPFVGRAGQLLTDIIEKGMKIPRKSVYIANVLKCRPPMNRDPQPNEIDCCTPALVWQIRIIRPKVIIALGAFASRYLLNTRSGINALRGSFHNLRLDGMTIPVMPTYHPSYVLREYTVDVRRKVWNDVLQVVEYLKNN